MNQYEIKGLSCANCAGELEEEIRKLEFGQTASLNYNSAKLSVDPRIPMDQVKKILKSDGAYIAHDAADHKHNHDHGHDHSHANNHRFLYLIIFSSAIFIFALILDAFTPILERFLIPFYIVAIVISGYTTFMRGLKNLTKLKFNIDTLMTIALIGATAIGEWKEATLVAILFGLNEWLEGLGMEKARRSMASLLQVAPKEAVVVAGGKETVVPIDQLQRGDIVKVKAGEKIPSDGTVIEGSSSVNEAAITGESLPIEKTAGSAVFGGSVNNEGLLHVRIDKAYEDSSLAKILHLVQEAQETKTPTELFINRFAKYYTPLIMIISALVIVMPPLFLGGVWLDWLYQGLAVLIVGCPCALILASPIAIVAGITRNARNGILIKGGVHLEQLGKIERIALDKTGTLTKGLPRVEKAVTWDEARFYRIAAAMEQSSSHPLAKAVVEYVSQLHASDDNSENSLTEWPEADHVQTIPGQGMTAEIEGKQYWLGNEKIIAHLQLSQDVKETLAAFKAEGLTIILAADQEQVLGVFGIADEIREESEAMLRQLKRVGIKETIMLTGDHNASAERVAAKVGISTVFSNLLPEDKVNIVKKIAAKGKIAMVGDGINDAPALAAADLGIAMGKGTDSAIETADIVLMQDHLGKLPSAIQISAKVNRIIRFNIVFALALKAIALLLTIPGWLTLWIAILSDMGATVFVTLTSLTVLLQGKQADLTQGISSKQTT